MPDDDPRKPQTEIERKFLVDRLPDPESLTAPTPIDQGYVAAGSDGTEVRLRRKGDRFYQTIKQGQGLSRLQTEVVLSESQFEAIWPLTEGRRVRKDRHQIPFGQFVIELDVFHGPLEGLVLAEVEFKSVEQAARFQPPEWFGEEVTNDSHYRNRNLALMGMPERRG